MALSVHQMAAARRVPRPGRRLAGPVATVRVGRAVWTAAVKAAGGNARRLRITDERTVIVVNAG